MKLLVAIFIISVAFGQYLENPDDYELLDLLPGLDFVGFGYDARFDTAQAALQIPIMQFSYSHQKVYSYATARETLYQVPDEIYVRNVAFTEAETYLFNSVDEYKQKVSLDVGINYQQLTGQGQANYTCVTTTNTSETNCTTDQTFNSEKIFSIGANIGFIKTGFTRDEIYLVENSEKTQLYNIFLDSRFIRQEVKDDLRDLSNYLFQDNQQLYFKFLEKYGTHYVVSATMGGQVTMQSTIQKKVSENNVQVTAGVGGGFSDSVSESDALASANKQFSQTLNAQVDFSFNKVDKRIELQSTSVWRLLGGNSSIVNLLDTRNASQAIKAWKQTITGNPVPVVFRLKEISTLFDDPLMRDQLANAVFYFLNFDTSDILIKSNFQGLPTPSVVKRSLPDISDDDNFIPMKEKYLNNVKKRSQDSMDEIEEEDFFKTRVEMARILSYGTPQEKSQILL